MIQSVKIDLNPVITTQCLTRFFGETLAVNNLDLEVYPGEIFGFLGHNGAGKTTTIRLLNGVLAPTEGKARVFGLSPIDQGPQLRRRTGVLTETPSLDERLTGRDNLAIFADLYAVPVEQVSERVDELLTIFDLERRADEKVGHYSKGMKQRLALARALVHRPELLFLDEPTSGLDPATTRQVHELIQRLSREEGRTIFLNTHNLDEAQRLCDRVGVMEHGRLLAVGSPADLATQTRQAQKLLVETDLDMEDKATRTIALTQPGLEVRSTGGGLLEIIGVAREEIPTLLTSLAKAGIPIYQATPLRPSLADVYFALHGGELTTVGE